MILSQFVTVASVSTYIPLTVYVFPFHSTLSHAIIESFIYDVLLITKSMITMLSHPLIVVSVSTYIPLVVYTFPFQL